jgi:mono/diheme cytochrome c family protein
MKILLTVLITFVVSALLFVLYIYSGSYNISQTDPHIGLTKWVIRQTKHHSIEKRMKENTPPSNLNDSAMLIEGFHHYNSMCVDCHGGPGVRPEEMREGLYPKPPLIYKHKDQEDPQEFFWIIKNGIKMTSMPAYGPTHDDTRIWAITSFVTNKLNKMSEEEYKAWKEKYKDEE